MLDSSATPHQIVAAINRLTAHVFGADTMTPVFTAGEVEALKALIARPAETYTPDDLKALADSIDRMKHVVGAREAHLDKEAKGAKPHPHAATQAGHASKADQVTDDGSVVVAQPNPVTSAIPAPETAGGTIPGVWPGPPDTPGEAAKAKPLDGARAEHADQPHRAGAHPAEAGAVRPAMPAPTPGPTPDAATSPSSHEATRAKHGHAK